VGEEEKGKNVEKNVSKPIGTLQLRKKGKWENSVVKGHQKNGPKEGLSVIEGEKASRA